MQHLQNFPSKSSRDCLPATWDSSRSSAAHNVALSNPLSRQHSFCRQTMVFQLDLQVSLEVLTLWSRLKTSRSRELLVRGGNLIYNHDGIHWSCLETLDNQEFAWKWNSGRMQYSRFLLFESVIFGFLETKVSIGDNNQWRLFHERRWARHSQKKYRIIKYPFIND